MNNFQKKEANTIFETARGTVFLGSNQGLIKSTNSGKTWKQFPSGGWVMKLVESNGVLLATGQDGILRSTDDGENRCWVISEGGVGIAVFDQYKYPIRDATHFIRWRRNPASHR